MEFSLGSVPIEIASAVFKKDPSWVRTGIVTGYLPIGVATRDGEKVTDKEMMSSKYGRINYYISPKLLYDFTGYYWNGSQILQAP